ncbi:MAG: UDP-N-acetylmuramate dehydrogenase [Betaproteobacteria bacterium]|nr:UDP-N-acetylmuramate dehydrogenase [Betaproteobacteria bacterium]
MNPVGLAVTGLGALEGEPLPLRGLLRENEPMERHVSWRAGGRAKVFYQPADVADLQSFLVGRPAREAIMFVGLGSNLLVRDGGFDGAVVFTHHALGGIRAAGEIGTRRTFVAGGGVPAPHLARFVARHDCAGAEWLAGIPGTIGGALAMNAGCHGGETWNHVVDVTTVDRAGTLRLRDPREFETGYRHVAKKTAGEEWFVAATFAFEPGERDAAMARMKSLLERRVASQPLSQPNAGSVFRNPPADHAARLIEACGLKGHTIGGAQVSTKHANFIVNLGTASAADIEAVIDHVQVTVKAATGIELVREVHIVGRAGGANG